MNKLDTCGWSQQVFEGTKARLHQYIVGPECGFKEKSVTYVPLSGFTGENMVERSEPDLAWWNGPTLVEALDNLPAPTRPAANGALRISISDFYKTGASTCASGTVESGTVSVGQRVLLLPSRESITVKSLQCRGEATRSAVSGEYVDSIMLPIDPQYISCGGVICDPSAPVAVVDSFQAQILVFDVDVPLMRGQQVMCYLHTDTLTATLARLEKLVVKGKPQDKKPKCLQKGNVAIVRLQVNRRVCVETKSAGSGMVTSLSRLVLRDRGRTVAAGVVSGI